MSKECIKCHQFKDLVDFEMRNQQEYYATCTKCREERKLVTETNKNKETYSKKYYKENKAHISARNKNKRPYKEYKEYFSKYKKNYYQNNKEEIKEKVKNYRQRNMPKILLDNARRRATKFNIPFSLVLDDIIIPELCPVLGIPIILGTDLNTRDSAPSIDRILPHLGYTKDNIEVISYKANTIKNSGCIEDFEKIINYIRKYSDTNK